MELFKLGVSYPMMKFPRASTLLSILVFGGASAMWSLFAQSAVQSFLTIPGIPGESVDSEFRDAIDIHSFGFGVKGPTSLEQGKSERVGKPEQSPITVIKNVDRATLELFLACVTGKTIPTAEISTRQVGGKQKTFYKITLFDVTIATLNNDTANNGTTASLVESVALNYAKIKITYTPQRPDGTSGPAIDVGYDLKANKKI